MRCNNCASDNSDDALFCGNCGEAIGSPAAEELGQRQAEFTGERRSDGTTFEPSSLSKLLVESARVYGRNLPVFLVIGLIPQIPGLLGLGPLPLWWSITLVITSLGLTALSFGAVTHAVAIDYLGLTPSVASSYSRAWRRVVTLEACLFIYTFLLAGSLLLSLVLVGIPILLVLLVVLWLYPQAVMLENLRPVEAFGRSISLVRGSWLRVFGIVAACWILPSALSLAVLYLSNDSVMGRISLITLGTLTGPWTMIGSTLMYFDLRVRKEAYGVELLEAELEITSPS